MAEHTFSYFLHCLIWNVAASSAARALFTNRRHGVRINFTAKHAVFPARVYRRRKMLQERESEAAQSLRLLVLHVQALERPLSWQRAASPEKCPSLADGTLQSAKPVSTVA